MENQNLAAGLDIGSRSIELALLEGDRLVDWAKVPTTFDPLAQCRRLLKDVQAENLVATGYGRKLALEQLRDRQITAITEIQAYARGARFLSPETRTVLDIGGQDTMVITLNAAGRVARFEMNDRCAAGTGKFLEFMALALHLPIEEFGSFALGADKRIQISSMCTVFAESEATSLMARGETPANIALGLHLAIVQRTLANAPAGGGRAAPAVRRRGSPQCLCAGAAGGGPGPGNRRPRQPGSGGGPGRGPLRAEPKPAQKFIINLRRAVSFPVQSF